MSQVVWLEMPRPDPEWEPVVEVYEDPARHEVLHEAMAVAAAAQPDRVTVVDFDGWFEARGWLTDEEVRPDGVHFTSESSSVVAEEFLADAVLRAALGLG